mmetsp:Transcript_37022/g.59300  ORF Transcript_37022/g.59300 Transcript_37022/m.59300 type:complete len:213 (-) Transcript_37022:27-665(-)
MATLSVLISVAYLLSDAVQGSTGSVEVNADGSVKERESMDVEFENESGRDVELWSDTAEAVFFKASLKDREKATVKTVIGEKMYFTPTNSGGSHERAYYAIEMSDNQEKVTLFDRETMEELQKAHGAGCKGPDGRCHVYFANKTGKKLRLFWDNGKQGILQATIRPRDETVVHTFVGHTFFATFEGKEEERIFTHTVSKDSKIVSISQEIGS